MQKLEEDMSTTQKYKKPLETFGGGSKDNSTEKKDLSKLFYNKSELIQFDLDQETREESKNLKSSKETEKRLGFALHP